MKKLNILKTLLFLPILSIIPFSFISHQPTTLINKTSSLTTVGDTFTIQSGGDWGGTAGALKFEVLTDPLKGEHGTVELSGPDGGNSTWYGKLIINSTVAYDGYTYDVVSLRTGSFSQAYNLTSVELNSKKITLKGSSFEKSGIISFTSSITTDLILLTSAFYDCSHFTTFDIPTLKTIHTGQNAFKNSPLLSGLSLPMLEEAYFDDYSFQGDYALKVLDFPKVKTMYIGIANLQGVYNLEFANFPKWTSGSIAGLAFQGCSSLPTVNMPLFSGTFTGNTIFSYSSLFSSINLSGLKNGTVIPETLFASDSKFSDITFGEVDPTTMTFGSNWLNGTHTAGGGINFHVPYKYIPLWEEVYNNSSNWGNTANFEGYTPVISASVTENKLVERSVSSTATLTITQAEFTPDLSTLSADLGKSGLSISSFEDGVAIIKTNKASAGTKHIIISCAGCEDLDVTVVVAYNFNSYLWIILSFSIGLGITSGAAIFFFVDKKRKQEEKK